MKVINQTSAGGIVRKNSLWLICQHSQHKGWVFPKGIIGDKVDHESMEQAALRETEEETGIKAKIIMEKPIKTFYQFRFQEDLIKKTVFYFFMEYVSGDINKHDWEMQDVKFVTADEVKKKLTYKSDQDAFEKVLNLLSTYPK